VLVKLSCIRRGELKGVAVLVPPNANEIVLFVVMLPFVKLSVAVVVGGFKGLGLIAKGDPVRNILLGAVPAVINKVPVVPPGTGVEEKLCTASSTAGITIVAGFVQTPVEVIVIVSAASLLIENVCPSDKLAFVTVVGDIVPPVMVTLKLGPKSAPAPPANATVTFLDIFFYILFLIIYFILYYLNLILRTFE
jgi:hypothetical protein